MNNNIYWTEKTEQAIIQFNAEVDNDKRNQIFEDSIYQPLYRLCEAVLHYGDIGYREFDTFEDCIIDGVSWVASKLDTYQPHKDSKSFSYFNKIVKNYYINLSMKYCKIKKQNIPIVVDDNVGEFIDYSVLDISYIADRRYQTEITDKIMIQFYDMYDYYKNKKTDKVDFKKSDMQLLDKIKNIIEDKINIDKYLLGKHIRIYDLFADIMSRNTYQVRIKKLINNFKNHKQD
jgi:hypothetical protein